jgi:Tol biopolymer transport system component
MRVAASLALLTLILCASSSAAFRGRNGDILFSSLRVPNGRTSAYLMRPDGSRQRPFMPSLRLGAAAWSPDGERLAFAKEVRHGCAKVFVVRANGTGLHRITRDVGCYFDPAWSPDGRRIAATRCTGRCMRFTIWSVDLRRGQLRRLTDGPSDWRPAWSPDGSTIAFIRGYPPAVWLVDSAGGDPYQVTTPPRHPSTGDDEEDNAPAWSPDGRWIAFTREHQTHEGAGGGPRQRIDIYLVQPDGTGLRQLTRLEGVNLTPDWSPDGKRIVFASSRAHVRDRTREDFTDIWVMNADGSEPKRLTTTPLDHGNPRWRPRH